jgi:hypothetical protein
MPSKSKPRKSKTVLKFGRGTLIKVLLLLLLLPLIAAAAFLIRYYYIFDGIIETKLGQRHQIAETKIFAAPTILYPGKPIGFSSLVARVRRLGYAEDGNDADAAYYRIRAAISC